MTRLLHISIVLCGLLASCGRPHTLFTGLPASQTGIHFRNDIREDDSTDSFIDEFGYMGGGVGIGDFNNDGLKDIFFTGNQVSCRLYINKGNGTFDDVTEKAGLTTTAWATGVSIVDINNDGYDDIYVCVFGKNLLQRSKNLLFINQRDGTFHEEAEAYGLADMGYSTQAVFLDYDKDGDLDMYLSNYLLNGPNANTVFPKDLNGTSPANDRLYRNDGDAKGLGHPVFTDVSRLAGIRDCGYGLGVVTSDFNNDGWPDIYVADDFVSDDLLWLNNTRNGFNDRLSVTTRHTSYSSMGVDAADINNDGLPDIVTLDMLPETNRRRKMTFSFMNYERYQLERSMGYHPQFMRNMLQLNNGNRPGTDMPFFSEIGQLAGISATDWSWSVLLADFDNDGWKDIHITNGIGRDFINTDFLDFSNTIFSGSYTKKEQHQLIRDRLASLNHVELSNYLYLNHHDLTFTDASKTAGIDAPSLSGGAAYVDLDNDGDLDLVVNNINKEAFVFINNTTAHHLGLILKGDKNNKAGFGTKVSVYAGGLRQTQEENPVRGYFSSVDTKLLFGLGDRTMTDSLLIQWPDNKQQLIYHIPADTTLTIDYQNARTGGPRQPAGYTMLFTNAAGATNIQYLHKENRYNDFAFQVLLPQKYSQLGPFITTGDVNNDGLADFFIGGAFHFPGRFFLQQPDGRFTTQTLPDSIKLTEDMDCALFDSCLLVTCGDRLFDDTSVNYIPRLYHNDGKGHFTLAPGAIPVSVKTSAGAVAIGDFNGDEQKDIFIGGRIAKEFPLSPGSYFLQNDHGHFTDVTASVCPELSRAGMITSAKWVDFDNDGQPDLVIAGEWMPVRFFKNTHGRLREVTDSTGLGDMHGMWRSLAIADIDGDGDADIIAGNLGLNCDYAAGSATPMELYAADLDGNRSIDPVVCYYIKDEDGVRRPFPAVGRKRLAEQVPFVKKQFLYNRDYVHAAFSDIYHARPGSTLLRLYCTETRTCWLENKGHGRFVKHVLPVHAQLAPVNAIVSGDLDHDGKLDLVLAGNEYQAEVMRGRYDASYGCFLKGDGRGGFSYSSGAVNGLVLQGDIKSMALLPLAGGGRLLLAAANDDSLQVMKIK